MPGDRWLTRRSACSISNSRSGPPHQASGARGPVSIRTVNRSFGKPSVTASSGNASFKSSNATRRKPRYHSPGQHNQAAKTLSRTSRWKTAPPGREDSPGIPDQSGFQANRRRPKPGNLPRCAATQSGKQHPGKSPPPALQTPSPPCEQARADARTPWQGNQLCATLRTSGMLH